MKRHPLTFGDWTFLSRPAICILLVAALTGCSTATGLRSARSHFYAGDLVQAEKDLAGITYGDRRSVLALMERGTIRQTDHKYKESAADWIEAANLAEALEYYSVSRGAASFLSNDRALAYRGAPYERTLLHTFAAKNYLAIEKWDDAAVEARNIVQRLENLDGFPDDAYSRYMAGLCFELIDDHDAASRQYASANKLARTCYIDPLTGRLTKKRPANSTPPQSSKMPTGAGTTELVCFILIGRSPREDDQNIQYRNWGPKPYAEIRVGGKILGRSYSLSTTASLLAATNKRTAAVQLAKDVTRVVTKEIAAGVVANENEVLGELVWLLLFAMETDTVDRWETLPGWLQVARVQCPDNLTQYDVIFHGRGNSIISTRTVSAPLTKRGKAFVSFCREW